MKKEHQAILDYLADGKRRSACEIASWIGISLPETKVLCTELLDLGAVKRNTHKVFNRDSFDYAIK